jgi:hypothetical protein
MIKPSKRDEQYYELERPSGLSEVFAWALTDPIREYPMRP